MRHDVIAIAPDLFDNKKYNISMKIFVRKQSKIPIGLLWTLLHEVCHHNTGS